MPNIVGFSGTDLNLYHNLLVDLTEMYCQMWEYDPNFGEYKKCHECGKFYSHAWVEANKFVTKTPCCASNFVPAWPRKETMEKIISHGNDSTFVGYLLVEESEILGFSWGKCRWNYEMTEKLGNELYSPLLVSNPEAPACFYLEELAVSPSQRGRGYGRQLANSVLSGAVKIYPNHTSVLTTHKNSDAVKIYIKAGYAYLGDHPGVEDRVTYGIDRVSSLQLDNI